MKCVKSTHAGRAGKDTSALFYLHSLYPALVFKQSNFWTHSPGLKKGVSHTAMKSCFLECQNPRLTNNLAVSQSFWFPFMICTFSSLFSPKLQMPHFTTALPHFTLGTSQGCLCCSSLSWCCRASGWRSRVQFQYLVSSQLRLMGSCWHFEENTLNESLFLCIDDTSNLCSFSVRQLQLLITIQPWDVATLHCKPLCSHPLLPSPAPAGNTVFCFWQNDTHLLLLKGCLSSCPPPPIQELP